MTRLTPGASATILVTFLVVASLIGPLGTVGTAAAAERISGNPDLTVIAPENRLVAGTETTVQAFVVNTGRVTMDGPEQYEALVQTARAVTLEASSSGPITVVSGEYPVGTVPEGVSGPVPLTVRVDEDAEPGTYEIPVRFTYDYTSSVFVDGSNVETTERNRRITETLEVVVERRPAFQVVSTGSSLSVGNAGSVTLELQNVGTVGATDATVTLSSPDPEITFGAGTPQAETFVGDWAAGENKSIEVRARVAEDALVRPYTITAVVTYRDEDGQERTSRRLVSGVSPQAGASFDLAVTESDLRPGGIGRIEGTVENTGDTTAEDVVLRLASQDPTVVPIDSEVPVGTLGPGETAQFEYSIALNEGTSPGVRRLPFAIEYGASAGNNRSQDQTDVTVSVSARDPAITVAPRNATFEVDSTGRLVLAVTNTESTPQTDVTVRIGAEPPLSSDDAVAFIPRLESEETRLVVFDLQVSDEAVAKTQAVAVNVSYRDEDGRLLATGTQQIPVEIVEPTTTFPVVPVAVIVIALVGVGIWWWRRR
ncbi:COG1361 S-layer family protein [Haloferax sp. DFSO60]|uniref:COG1361 S-layer family protein n=1 Tax=Haloferax sp. DFSO60 TaxID=3388652 RepID=UPI00397D0485